MTTFLLLVLIAFAGFLYFAAQKPDTFRIERSAVLSASAERVFGHLNNLKRWNEWSPWATKDPDMKLTYSGPSDGIGSAQAWEGNSNVGKGRMEIIESVPNAKVRYKLDFEKPMHSSNVATLSLNPEGTGTRVTWVMEGPVPFPSKIMHTLFDMDRMIGQDFEAGLANLQKLVEPGA